MVGQFIQAQRGDEDATAARITFELEESTEAAVREAQNRAEYEQIAQQLSAELTTQAAQLLQYLEGEQRTYAQARVSTVEAVLARNTPKSNPTCTTPTSGKCRRSMSS